LRSDRQRLEDIQTAIARIEAYGPKSCAELRDDPAAQDVAVHRLEIIGEAVSRLSFSVKARYASVPWNQIVGMRNRMIHVYHEVDLDVVWQVIDVELPPLKATVEAMLKEVE